VADALRLYFRLLGVSLKSQMEYRVSFLMQGTGIMLIFLIELAGILALFDRFGRLGTWSLPEVALLYGMVHTSFSLAELSGRGFDEFSGHVRTGDFDRILLRPRSTLLQVAGLKLPLHRLGRHLQGVVVLLWALWALGIPLTPARISLLALAVTGGAMTFYGVFILYAVVCFWTVESLEMMNIVTHGGLEAGQYPLDIYRPWLRRVFYVVPVACAAWLPSFAILGRTPPPGIPVLLPWLAPLAGPAFLLVAARTWEFGVRRYRSTGS